MGHYPWKLFMLIASSSAISLFISARFGEFKDVINLVFMCQYDVADINIILILILICRIS